MEMVVQHILYLMVSGIYSNVPELLVVSRLQDVSTFFNRNIYLLLDVMLLS